MLFEEGGENFYGWFGQNTRWSQGRAQTKSNAVVQSDIIQYFSALKVCSGFTECLILQTILRTEQCTGSKNL